MEKFLVYIDENSDNITVASYDDTFYVIDKETFNGQDFFLLESETYGDEVPCIIVDKNNNVMLEDVYNGFNDYREQVLRIK